MKALTFTDRPGHRNLDTPFAAFIGKYKLQFNRIAAEMFFLTDKKNYYIAVDREDKLNRFVYLFAMNNLTDEKTFPIQSGRFPFIECPELTSYFKGRDDVYFLIERYTYQSLQGFRLTKYKE